ncbi:MAG: AsmA family protein [Rhodobacteraceae bacterium]|nr:AsmA family protein [Paracoccaceae bacterium]
MRWIFRLIGVLALLVVAGVVAVSLIPSDKIAAFAARELSNRLGREVRFLGEVRPVFYPVVGVRTGGISIANAEWAGEGAMLSADSLLVGVEIAPLLSGDIRIAELRIGAPVIRLERGANGRGNWEIGASSPAAPSATAAAGTPPAIVIAEARITDGSVSFRDRKTGGAWAAEHVDLTLKAPRADGPALLAGGLRYQGTDLTFALDVAETGAFLAGRVTPLTFALKAGFGNVDWQGRAGLSPTAAEGRLALDLKDPDAALALAGSAGAGLAGPVKAEATVTFTDTGGLFLRQAVLEQGSNRIAGDIDMAFGAVPVVTARLEAGALNVPAMFRPQLTGQSGSGSASNAGWSKERIDLGFLQAFDGRIALSAASVDLGDLILGPVRLGAGIDKGRAVLALDNIGAYGGSVTGTYVINTRNGLSMRGDLVAKGIRLQPLLVDLAGYDRLTAPADAKIEFLTSGDSMDKMMKALSGSGSFAIGQGEIIGFDLAGMLRTLDPSYRGDANKTIFSSITGTYRIAAGELLNDDLVFKSPLANASGAGRIGIGKRDLDYRVAAFSADDSGGIRVPVMFSGTWDDINIHPDLDDAINAEIDKKRREVEDKIRADLEAKRDAVADQVREEVEQRVEDEAKKLLEDLLKRATGTD